MNSALTLVVLGLFGSAALAGLAFVLGFNKNARFDNESDIAQIVSARTQEGQARAIAIASDGICALARTSDNKLYLITSLGDKSVVRALLPEQITYIKQGHVRLAIGDVGVPTLEIYGDPSKLDAVLKVEPHDLA
jgi:hypothetical protein